MNITIILYVRNKLCDESADLGAGINSFSRNRITLTGYGPSHVLLDVNVKKSRIQAKISLVKCRSRNQIPLTIFVY